jgi:hypothetical protein
VLTALTFRPTGTEGYAKAEVTAGGVSTAALSSKTMEARDVPGLYVIGEAVDVMGWLGGYSFQLMIGSFLISRRPFFYSIRAKPSSKPASGNSMVRLVLRTGEKRTSSSSPARISESASEARFCLA